MNGETHFDENEVYDILRNERRRNVLRILSREGEETSIGELADAIATAETGERPPPSDTRQSVYVSLHQTHLPKLDNFGVIEYDREDRTIVLLPAAAEMLARLNGDDGAENHETAARYALVIVGISVLELLATATAVVTAPATVAPITAVATLVVAAIAALCYRSFSATD